MTWLRRRAPQRQFEAFQIEVTSRCNLKCVMCPVTVLAGQWAQRDLSWETFGRAAEAFARVNWVYLQGWGEPLLHRRFFDMIARAKSAGCRVGFTTNGTRLTRATGARLLDAGLDLMAVSIAGASAATHEAIRVGSDLQKLLENLRGFLALRRERGGAGPKVEVFYLMTPANLAELPRAALEAASAAARASGIAFRPYRLQPREMAVCDLNPLKIVYIGSDGSVSPCVCTSLAGPAEIPRVFEGRPLQTPVVRFGNLNAQPFAEIWESAAYREFRALFAKRVAGAGLAMLGAAGGVAPEESPAPEACRTCPKLYGV